VDPRSPMKRLNPSILASSPLPSPARRRCSGIRWATTRSVWFQDIGDRCLTTEAPLRISDLHVDSACRRPDPQHDGLSLLQSRVLHAVGHELGHHQAEVIEDLALAEVEGPAAALAIVDGQPDRLRRRPRTNYLGPHASPTRWRDC